MDNWIPVSEKLPDKYSEYIVYEEYEGINKGHYKIHIAFFNAQKQQWQYNAVSDYLFDNVKFWQPLPPPPKQPEKHTQTDIDNLNGWVN